MLRRTLGIESGEEVKELMLGKICAAPNNSVEHASLLTRRKSSEFGRSGREIFGKRCPYLGVGYMIHRFAGDVNLENRLHKAARNIPQQQQYQQQQQMRAYSTTSHSQNALQKSRQSRRRPLIASTRSYATETTNPNPPFGKTSDTNI